VRVEGDALADFVEFIPAGAAGAGSYRCAECRYGISLTGLLPTCPMCGGVVWEPTGTHVPVDEPARR
jgi:hypothetical protein